MYALFILYRINYLNYSAFSINPLLSVLKLEIILIILFTTCASIFIRKKITSCRTTACMIFLVVIPVLLSILNNPNPNALSIGLTFTALITCIVVLYLPGKDYYLHFLGITRVLSYLILLVSFCLVPISVELTYVDGQRFNGIFSNPHGIGRLAALNIILCLYQKKGFYSFFNYSLFILSIVSLALSQSVNAFLSVACTLVLVTMILQLGLRKSIFLALFLGAIMVILSSYILEPMLNALGREVHLSGRLFAWYLAYDLISQNPLLGVGMQNTKQIIFESGVSSTNFHNSFIEVGVRSGLLGLVCYLLLIYWALEGARFAARASKNKSILGYLCIMLFFCMGNSTIFSFFFIDFYLFWLIVLMCGKIKLEGKIIS